jgi:hypothetical protein
MKQNNLNMNSFQDEDINNYNPNSSPKEEMVSLTFIFNLIIYPPRKITHITLKIITTTAK